MPGSGQARATASAESFARRSQQADDASSRYGRSRSEAREEARAAKAATLKIVAGDPRVTDRASSTLDAPKAGAGFSLHDDDYIAGTPAQVAEQVIERPNRAASLAHCTDMLSAKENPNSCKVRLCQKSCEKSLHCHMIDRGAPWSLSPAIKRSVVCASPVVRYPSPNCDQAKARRSAQAADFVQTHCSRPLGRSPARHVRKSSEARMQEPRPPYRLFADPTRDRFGNVRYCGERTRERTWRYRRE
jgi:hypothetical protein